MQINDPFLNQQVDHLVGIALAAHARQQNPQQVLQRYAADPATRLSANIAQGIVAQQLAAVNNQQGLQAGAAAAQTPTVLDQMEMQGLANLPMGNAFDPGLYEQGIGDGLGLSEEEAQGPVAYGARGGVVAFQEGGINLDDIVDYEARSKVIEGIEADRDRARAAAESAGKPKGEQIDPKKEVTLNKETPEAKAAREARINAALERNAAREAAEAKVRGGVRGAIPGPVQVAPSGIAAAGPTAPPVVQAVTPQVAPAAGPAPAPGPTPTPSAGPAPAAGSAGSAPSAGAAPSDAPAKPSLWERMKQGAKSGATAAGRASFIPKWGLGAPLAAGLGWMGGQTIGNWLNENTGIQEGIRGLLPTSSAEDEANRTFEPGYIPGQIQQNKVVRAAEVDPLVGNIANTVSREEAGGDFFSSASLGRVNPGNTSFGSFQLDISGGLPAFVKEHGVTFGLTAKMGTPEFAAQWKAAADKDPTKFGAAQLKTFEKEYLNPTRTYLSSVLPGRTDPRVLNYFTSRGVQLGAGTTKRDGRVIADMYNAADGDVEQFLHNMSVYDEQNYDKYFGRESRKPDTDKSKYTRTANEKRITQRLNNALGMTAKERRVAQIGRQAEAVKEYADVVGEQPLVQRGRGLVTDLMERGYPLKTGLEPKPAEKPTAAQTKTVQEYLKDEANIEAARARAAQLATNKQERDDIAMALMLSGAATMAGTSPHAFANLGAGFSTGLKGYMDRQTKREDAAVKAYEKEADRATKRYERAVALELGLIKADLPGMGTEGARRAIATARVITNLNARDRALNGISQQEYLAAVQHLRENDPEVGAKAGAKAPSGFKVTEKS